MKSKLSEHSHPIQPIDFDEHWIFSKEDYTQLMQLIGYSVSGFGELSLVSPETIKVSDLIAEDLYI
jgi:hypothetical protein